MADKLDVKLFGENISEFDGYMKELGFILQPIYSDSLHYFRRGTGEENVRCKLRYLSCGIGKMTCGNNFYIEVKYNNIWGVMYDGVRPKTKEQLKMLIELAEELTQ